MAKCDNCHRQLPEDMLHYDGNDGIRNADLYQSAYSRWWCKDAIGCNAARAVYEQEQGDCNKTREIERREANKTLLLLAELAEQRLSLHPSFNLGLGSVSSDWFAVVPARKAHIWDNWCIASQLDSCDVAEPVPAVFRKSLAYQIEHRENRYTSELHYLVVAKIYVPSKQYQAGYWYDKWICALKAVGSMEITDACKVHNSDQGAGVKLAKAALARWSEVRGGRDE